MRIRVRVRERRWKRMLARVRKQVRRVLQVSMLVLILWGKAPRGVTFLIMWDVVLVRIRGAALLVKVMLIIIHIYVLQLTRLYVPICVTLTNFQA
jgi:hypothetical protein